MALVRMLRGGQVTLPAETRKTLKLTEGDYLDLAVADGTVTLKPVTVKSYETNDVVITGGVDEGARVVALGVQKLDPARKVRVVSSLSF